MKARTGALVAVGAVAVAAATIGTTSAIGALSGKKPTRCKAQACVHVAPGGGFYTDGVLNVLATGRESEGIYCIQLSSKLVVDDTTAPQLTIDANNSSAGAHVAAWGQNSACNTAPNSMRVLTYDTATGALENAAFVLTIP